MFYSAQVQLPGSEEWHYIARGRVVREDNAKAYHHPSAAKLAGNVMIVKGVAVAARVVRSPHLKKM